jgi:hypothetical protein
MISATDSQVWGLLKSSAGGEERLHDGGGFGREDAGNYFDLMIEAGRV